MTIERILGRILRPKTPKLVFPSDAQKLILGGRFDARLFRKGKLIDEWSFDNLVVNEGLNSNLNVYFNAGTPITTWFLGIYQGNYTPVATDTAATIASNSTECSAYSGGVRPTWTNAAPSSQSITNSANPGTFTFTGSQTIYGAFLISNSTINGTAGTLFAAARFGASKAVVASDQLLLTYSFTASSV